MLVAKVETGREVTAWQTNKQEAPFFCPNCGSRLTLKQGNARIHHFAHASDSNCLHGSGETQEHLNAKKTIYDALAAHPRVSKLALERDLKIVRPDISCYIDQTRVAIEIQRSDLSIQTVVHRLREYQQMKVALLWVLTSPPPLGPALVQELTREDCVRLKDWQRYSKRSTTIVFTTSPVVIKLALSVFICGRQKKVLVGTIRGMDRGIMTTMRS